MGVGLFTARSVPLGGGKRQMLARISKEETGETISWEGGQDLWANFVGVPILKWPARQYSLENSMDSLA